MTLKPKSGYKIVKRSFGKCEEIPEMWELDKIQNHVKITTGSRNTQDKIETGKYPFFVRSKNIEKINSYSYDGEAVLTVGDGRIGEIFHYVNGKFDFHQRVYKISNFDQLLDGYFFYLYFSTFFLHRAKSMTAKNTVDSVRMNMITEMLIPLPPILEQQKIASILSEVDALIESTQKVIEKTKRLKKGMMQQLLTMGIGHKKFKRIEWLFEKEIEIPEEWKCIILDKLTPLNKKSSIRMGPFGSSLKKHELLGSGKIKTLWIENIVTDKFVWKYQKFITKEKYEQLKGFTVKPNDLLMTMMGTLGKIAIVPSNIGTAVISSHLLKITPDSKKLTSKFLYYFLKSQFIQQQIIKESHGLVMGGLNTGIVKKLLIITPPINEQQKIASILSGVDAYIQKNQQYKERLEKLKKGLMQKLLTGQIRVKV